ncbi:MAG: Hsp20/alpha crystallin family protein [Alphaproteobacteria bacterium]|nr:Hsp20/alpha crystallin family protein [Alphaproteobacteria bacterium]
MAIRDLLRTNKTNIPVHQRTNPILSLQDEMNRLFNNFFGGGAVSPWEHFNNNLNSLNPSIDVSEKEKEFKIVAEIPGINVQDIEITASDGHLTIKGEKKQENKEEHEDCYHQECSYGSFQRTITLPETANLDDTEAQCKNGILTITIPKKLGSQSKTRKIEIKQNT